MGAEVIIELKRDSRGNIFFLFAKIASHLCHQDGLELTIQLRQRNGNLKPIVGSGVVRNTSNLGFHVPASILETHSLNSKVLGLRKKSLA